MLPLIGAGIAAGTSLIGGMMAQDTADENRAAQERIAAQNIALQREFAQQGIRWKVEDAKAAGIHPLYALGASTTSFAPVSIGSSSASPMASALASAGQDVGRALSATSTSSERATAFSEAASKLQLDNMALQNQLLASKIATINQGGGNPPIPSIGPLPVIPEEQKQDPRPPIQIGGTRIYTDPTSTNVQKIEDRWGDDSLPSHAASIAVSGNDIMHTLVQNYGRPATWPGQVLQYAWRTISDEARSEYGNFQRFVRIMSSTRNP